MGSLAKAPRYRIFEYMDELVENGHPYSMVQVRYTVGGDNGPPDPGLADTVRKWNEEHVSPRIPPAPPRGGAGLRRGPRPG